MKKVYGCLVIALLLARSGQAEDSLSVKADLARMQGQWTMTSGMLDGAPLSEEMTRQYKRTCQDDVVRETNGLQLAMRVKMTIDPTKTPKTIDYEILDGATKGTKQLGIYELDGETFKSCAAAPDAERPTEFTTKPGDRRVVAVWKLEKEWFAGKNADSSS